MPLEALRHRWHDAEPVREGAGGPLGRRCFLFAVPLCPPSFSLPRHPAGMCDTQWSSPPASSSSAQQAEVHRHRASLPGSPVSCSWFGHVRHSPLQAAAQGMSAALQQVASCPLAQPTGPGHQNFPARAGRTWHRPQFAGGTCGRRGHPRVSAFTPAHLEGAPPIPGQSPPPTTDI